MENSRPCKKCKKRSLICDDVTGNFVCSSCGIIQDFDNFEHHFGGLNGPTGTFIRSGTAGSGTNYVYKERKVYKAIQSLEHITSLLNFPDSRTSEVKVMVDTITEGGFGEGNWFPILIGACSYVVMRRDNKSLSLIDVAEKVDCDIYELGRMVRRVVDFLDLKLPEFDIVYSFERAIQTCFNLDTVGEDRLHRMIRQGIFLLQCLVKWYLTTGRRPLPVIVAVLVFVAQLNEVDIRIEDVSEKLHVSVTTSRLRYKELLERLVEVAQVLPWGKDITVKNVLKNAPFVIQYMELKSMSAHCQQAEKDAKPVLFDLDDLVGDCLSKDVEYGMVNVDLAKDSQYFELESSNSHSSWRSYDLEELKISPECLSMLYLEFSDEVSTTNSPRCSGSENRRKRRGLDLSECSEWWRGKSELTKKLLLKKILEKDVGLNAMPPSFISGCLENTRRRKKIEAAKARIAKIMLPLNTGLGPEDNLCFLKCTSVGKKRRKVKIDADWEDFVIETLLLHQVKEEEIEKGHYNTLLDLHVFSSGNM